MWGAVKLGATNLTVASHGCYLTVMACGMANWFKKDIDPGRLAAFANANQGFDGDGQIVWSVFPKLYPNVRLVDSAWSTNVTGGVAKKPVADCIERIKQANRRGQTVGICVDLIATNSAKPDHIVLALDTPDDLSQWTIMDPDGGRVIRFQDRYGDLMTGVYGYRILGGTPADFPADANESDKDAGQAMGLCIDQRYSKDDVLRLFL